MMESGELEDKIFLGFHVIKMVAFNHDPKRGLNCTWNTRSEQVTHKNGTSKYSMKFISLKIGRPLYSDRDPLLVIKNTMGHGITYHALFCKLNIGNARFCLKGYSAYDICPKYELEGILGTSRSAMTLGRYMIADEYIHSKNGNVLVCTDLYDQTYMKFGSLYIVGPFPMPLQDYYICPITCGSQVQILCNCWMGDPFTNTTKCNSFDSYRSDGCVRCEDVLAIWT